MFGLNDKIIKIACKGSTFVNITELKELQGDSFKSLTDEGYNKIAGSIGKYGFSFPFFIWIDPEGTKWTIDGHQRSFRVIKRMVEVDGWKLPEDEMFPAVEVFAKDKKEAKEKLLVLQSRPAELSEAGLTEFINEEDSKIKIEEVSDYLDYPEIDFDTNEPEGDENADLLPKEPEELQCPNCHYIGKQAEFKKKVTQ
jgi:hypothetical protein